MATLTWPRIRREGCRKTRLSKAVAGMTPESPNICLKEAIAASLGTSIEAPVTPEDICPDHLYPRRTGAVKEYDKQLKHLSTENFKLKLEIFFLLDQDKKEDEPTNKLQEQIELQVKAEELRKELDYKNNLLRETLKTLQQQETNCVQNSDVKESHLIPEGDVTEKQLSSVETVNSSSFLNEMSNNNEHGDQAQGTCMQDMEEAINILLAIATTSRDNETQEAATCQNSFHTVFQKLQEPISKKCMQFLRALYHLKEELKEKDEKIRFLEALVQKQSLPSELDSSDDSDKSYIKDENMKMMEQELNSLHNAIREKEIFIKDLLDERTSILDGSKASTENYISIIDKMEEEKMELEQVILENREQLNRMETEISGLQQKMEQEIQTALADPDDRHSQLDKLNNEKEEIQRKLETVEQYVLMKESEIRELKVVLSTKDAELEVVQKNLKDTQNELVRLKTVTGEKEKEVDDARNQACALELEREALKRNYSELETAFANLERIVSESGMLKETCKSPKWDSNLRDDLVAKERELFNACTKLQHLSELLEAEKKDKVDLLHQLSLVKQQDRGNSGTFRHSKDALVKENHFFDERNEKLQNRSPGKEASCDLTMKRQLESKDAELHELRKKYKESVEHVISLEKSLDRQSCRIKYQESSGGKTLDVENPGKSQTKIQNNVANLDQLEPESNPESLISISPSLYRRTLTCDFSKFGQTNDVLELKEEIFLIMLHIHQLEFELKEKTKGLTSQLLNTQAVCKMLHDHLEELSEFMEKLLQSEDISQIIRSSMTPDCLSRLENLLFHDLDQSLNLSRSVWMVDRESNMNSMLPVLDQLDLEPSKDRDLSIITITSHVRQDGAIIESSDAFEKTAANFSGRRSSKVGKLRSDKLDEMIKKGEKMCLEMRRLNIHNNELMGCLLKKLEGSDSNLTQQIDNHLKILRSRLENMISHCAKLFETFKTERSHKQLTEEKLEDSQNKYASLQDTQQRVSTHDYTLNNRDDLEACHCDISICLQELLDVQQKIGTSIHSNESDDHNEVKTKSKIGARLLQTARRTVEGLLQQIFEKEAAWREREGELLQYHHEFGVCLQELRRIQQKMGSQNQSTDCLDGGSNQNDPSTKLQQEIRKTTKILLQQLMEKEGALKLSRDRIVELERNFEVKKLEMKQIQDWNLRLQKESVEKTETNVEVREREKKLSNIAEKLSMTHTDEEESGEMESEHSKCQQQAEELELLRDILQKQQCQEKSELQNFHKTICTLEDEIKVLKANNNRELQLQQETANCAMEKLKQSNLQLTNELHQTKQRFNDLKYQVTRLTSEMESVLQTDVDLQEKNKIICTLELETSKLKQHLEAVTGEKLDLHKKVCQSNIDLQANKDLIDSLQVTTSNLKQQLEDLLKEKMDLEGKEYQTNAELQEKKNVIISLQESLSGVKLQMENTCKEKQRFQEVELRYNSDLQIKDNLIQSLEVQIFQLKEEIQDAAKEQQKLQERECQSDLDIRQKERLNHTLQVKINKLQQEVKNSTRQQQMLQDKTCQTDIDVEENDHLISSLEATISSLNDQLEVSEREKLELQNKCKALLVECRKQQCLLESKVSKEDAEVDSLHLSAFALQQEVNTYMEKFKQLEEWNLGIQQQVQEKERLWEDEKESLKKENILLRRKLKKTSVKKGTETSFVEHSSSNGNHTVQRLEKELKEAAQLNASLQLELKVYQHLGHNSNEGLTHQKDIVLELVEEMRQLRGELMRSVRANSKLRHQLENYIEQDTRGKKPDLALNSCASSSDNVHQLSQITCSPSLEAVATLLPSRLSSDSSLHARVRHLLGVPTLHSTSQPDGFSSSNEDLRSIYSSPDLGIESDPNRDSSSTASGHAVKITPIHHFNSGISFTDKIFDSFAGMEGNSLHVVGHLETFELLQKQVAESLVVLRGMKARLQDRLQNASNMTSPSKNMEYNTLKELDRSCYYLQVYLEKGKTLLSSFRLYPQISPLLEENSKLREEIITLHSQIKEQSSQLQTALEKLMLTQSKKEGMERAITKKLTKTRKVLKQAKCNLLEENRKPPQPTSDTADDRRRH